MSNLFNMSISNQYLVTINITKYFHCAPFAYKSRNLYRDAGRGDLGPGGEGLLLTQFLTEQLTIFQPGGQIMPSTLLLAPQIFGKCGVSVITTENRQLFA